jgi:autotransporter-associated beta strand protein
LNVNGGTVLANTITNGVIGGGNLTTVSVNGGTLGITSILGAVGSLAAPINNLTLNNSALQLQISGVQTNIETTTLTPGGSTNVINVSYLPPINSYPVAYPVIGFQGLAGSLNLGISNLPPASPPYQGYISNDTTTVYLVLTSGPTVGSLLDVWTGVNNGNWDFSTPNWKYLGTPATFANGVPVQFDDTATGTTSVNLSTTLLPASVTVSNNALAYTFGGSGRLSGSAGLTKAGTSSLTFTNSGLNDFIGGITINAGTLQFGAGGTGGNLPAADSITDNGTLVFNHSDNLTVPNSISGAGLLVQNGTNILTVTSSNSFSGATVVNSGTLILNGVLSGSLSNTPGSVIGGNGTNAGTVTVGGTLQPSAVANTPRTFSAGTLTANSGAVLKFDLSGTDNTPGNGINDLVALDGNLTANSSSISVNFLGVPQTNTPYTLINFGGAQSGTFNPTILGTHFTGTLNQGASPVTLTMTGPGANLKWASTSSAVWDTGATANWLNGLSASVFYAGDEVLFDDTPGVVTAVTIPSGATVYPDVITVNSTNNNFSIGAPGIIGGQTSILKYGPSLLTVNGGNTFSNTVQVFGGTVKLGANGSLGTGMTYVYSNATLDLGGRALSGSVTVSGAGAGGNGAIVDNTFVLNGDQNAVGAGVTIYLAGDTTFGCSNRWDIRNGSLSSANGNPYKLTVVGPDQFTLVNATVDSALGDVGVQSGSFAIQTTTLGASSGWAGDTTHSITVESNAQLELDSTSFVPLSRGINLKDGSILLSEAAADIVNGALTITGNVTVNVTVPTLEVDSSISGSGNLIKNGAGPMTLTAASAYTGKTIINGGKINLLGSGSLASSSSITLAAGTSIDVTFLSDPTFSLAGVQTLQGNGTIDGNLMAPPGTTVAPGTNSTSIGTLTVTNGVTLAGTALMKIDCAGGTNDVLSAVTITNGGMLAITNISGSPFHANDSFTLFKAASFTGSFSSITPATPGTGLVWNTNYLANGILAVGQGTVPPQPVITGVSLSGNTIVLTGTNGVPGENCVLLSSTNVTLSLSQWTPLATNSLAGATFTITNIVSTSAPLRFFALQVQ